MALSQSVVSEPYWEVPADWFEGPAIVIDFDDDGGDDEVARDELDESDDCPVVAARDVRPPLRRWAAGRALRAEPTCWSALVKRARELDTRSGAAVMSGILDSIDVLGPPALDLVLGLAERWPHRTVREAATALRNPPDPAAAPVTDASDVRAAAALSTAQPSLF